MALRALAFKIRFPAFLQRSPASRPIAPPQDTMGSTRPPKRAIDQMSFEQQFLAYEKNLRRCRQAETVGTILGISGGVYIVYLMAGIVDD
uniref:Uncharacterized protein n=1 Tax=Leersia perrieri TaxID=77586 RepID=A0A0D9WVF3_9ORYZ